MFKGVFVAIVTPFKNGRVDRAALRHHINFLIKNGVHGLVPCGTTGESATLNPHEYSEIVKIVVEEVKGRCPVIAGAGSNCTAKAIELAGIVEDAGANATLQVTPYYNKPTQQGLYEHFRAIAEYSKIPHILYNVPGRTSVNLLPETVVRLSEIGNIAGIKEASGNLAQVEEIRKNARNDFVILSGNDDQNFDIYTRGGNGAISVTANIAPKEVSNIWDLFAAENTDAAHKEQERLAELNKVMFIETNPIPVKTSLALMGMCAEEFRLPMTKMGVENRNKLESTLKKYSFI